MSDTTLIKILVWLICTILLCVSVALFHSFGPIVGYFLGAIYVGAVVGVDHG
jgi:hypothetical protein